MAYKLDEHFTCLIIDAIKANYSKEALSLYVTMTTLYRN